MSNRRNFFKSLAMLTGAASLSPQIFIPKFEPVRWKRNPAWMTAQYECVFIDCPPLYDEGVLLLSPQGIFPYREYYGKWNFVTGNVHA